ncbi:MAG TPA: hypothetical protein VIP70_00735 [Nitrososphaeraceae archaeon]
MVDIEECCDGMRAMIREGTIQPFTVFGQETAQMYVRGNNQEIRDYNQIKYCPFCARPINLRD